MRVSRLRAAFPRGTSVTVASDETACEVSETRVLPPAAEERIEHQRPVTAHDSRALPASQISPNTRLSERKRRRPESNRCRRLCRPLRSHSATAPVDRVRTILVVATLAARPGRLAQLVRAHA